MLLTLALSACGGGGEKAPPGPVKEEKASKQEEMVEEKKQEQKDLPKDEPKSGKAEEKAPEKDLPKSGKAGGEAKSGASQAGVPEGQDAQDFDRRVIRSAELGIRAEDVRESAAEAQQVASQLGGNVLRSQIDEDVGSVSADLVLSVPSERLAEALDELRGLAEEVTTDTIEGEDVTEEFVDLQARERNLLAAEQSLVELYDQSESVDDTLAIQRELTEIRGQIERVQGRLEYLEQRTDFSQITLSIQPAVGAPESRPAWDPIGIAARAWNASLRFLQALATAIISVVAFGWWLIPLLVVALVLWQRRRNKRGSGSADTDSSDAN